MFLFSSVQAEDQHEDDLIFRGHIAYVDTASEPYSGITVDRWDDNKVKNIHYYKKGILEKAEYFSSDGILEKEGSFNKRK